MKKLLVVLFMLTAFIANSQVYITLSAGPHFLNPNRNIASNSGARTLPKKGVAFNIEPEWRNHGHFTFGFIFSHSQFGFEKKNNSSISQAMFNFKFPFAIKRFEPYIGFGTGYINQTVNERYDRAGQETLFPDMTHYIGLSPYAGITFFAAQKLRITASYRYNMGIYSRQGFAVTPVSSGFNIGLQIFIRHRYMRA